MKKLNFYLSKHQFSWAIFILFWVVLLPMLLILRYNYPAADDFTCVYPVTFQWCETRNLAETLKTVLNKVADSYQNWQGNFFSVFMFMMTPMIFGIQYYFISNLFMFALIIGCSGYCIKALLRLLGMNLRDADAKDTFRIIFSLVNILLVWFMPYISDGVYWWNGAQYITASSLLYLFVGLFMNIIALPDGKIRRSVFSGMIAICLGGSFYPVALSGFVFSALALAAVCFLKKKKLVFLVICIFIVYALSFAVSCLAPGNVARQMRLSDGNTVSVVQTVLETFKASIKEAGGFLSLPVLILFLLIAICLWNPIRNSKITFKHPVFLFAGLYTMYAGCIAPGIYTGFGYHKERYMNAIYFIFLLFLFGSLLILECSFIRKLEKSAAESDAVHNMKTEAVVILQAFDCFGKRYGIRFLCILICLLVVGMSADVISNIPCVNAVKCLLDGSAKEFHASMKNREAYVLSVENFEDMQLSYYQNAPAIFKHDSLPFNGIYGVIRYYKWYLQMLQK